MEERLRITFDTTPELREKYNKILIGPRKDVMNLVLGLVLDFIEEGQFWDQFSKLAQKKVRLVEDEH